MAHHKCVFRGKVLCSGSARSSSPVYWYSNTRLYCPHLPDPVPLARSRIHTVEPSFDPFSFRARRTQACARCTCECVRPQQDILLREIRRRNHKVDHIRLLRTVLCRYCHNSASASRRTHPLSRPPAQGQPSVRLSDFFRTDGYARCPFRQNNRIGSTLIICAKTIDLFLPHRPFGMSAPQALYCSTAALR